MEELSFGWLLVKTLVAMGVILGLIFVLFRYLVPKMQMGRLNQGSHIQIVERVGLEPRKNLYVVRVGKKNILVGTTEQSISNLVDLNESDLE